MCGAVGRSQPPALAGGLGRGRYTEALGAHQCRHSPAAQPRAVRQIINAAGPSFSVALHGSSDMCEGSQRRANVTVLCAPEARSRILSVEEDCGLCCYSFVVASPAGCPVSCARDVHSGLVCGGGARGVCMPGASWEAATCVCHAGFSGAACSDGGGTGPQLPALPPAMPAAVVAAAPLSPPSLRAARARPSPEAVDGSAWPSWATPLALAVVALIAARTAPRCSLAGRRRLALLPAAYLLAAAAYRFGEGGSSGLAVVVQKAPAPVWGPPSPGGGAGLVYGARVLSREAALVGALADGAALRPGAPAECADWLNAGTLQKTFTAQVGQDAAIYYSFFAGWLAASRAGTYVDLGASDPRDLSNSYFLDVCLGWKGLCIEASAQEAEKLRRSSRSCTVVNMCAAERAEKRSFVGGGFSGHAVAAGTGGAGVACAPLHEILQMHNVSTVDVLFVDIEGNEVEALASMDWDAVPVSLVSVEQVWSNKMLDMLLHDGGFWKVADIGLLDDLYVRAPRLVKNQHWDTRWRASTCVGARARGRNASAASPRPQPAPSETAGTTSPLCATLRCSRGTCPWTKHPTGTESSSSRMACERAHEDPRVALPHRRRW